MKRSYSKSELCSRLAQQLIGGGATINHAVFQSGSSVLPWRISVTLRGKTDRRFSVFIWTIGHGGRTRSAEEYRIQTKLPSRRDLSVDSGTPLLLGYYNAAIDIAGRAAGNAPADDMEVYVSWNAVKHLQVGASSSCQVPYQTMLAAYLHGQSDTVRRLATGDLERIVAFRPEALNNYFALASGGHDQVTAANLESKI